MKHTHYNISGMTCGGCQQKVKSVLESIPGVSEAAVDLASGEAVLVSEKEVPLEAVQDALKDHPKYHASTQHTKTAVPEQQPASWLQTYKPVLLIFAYITLITGVMAAQQGGSIDIWMSHFMAGFFLSFSFFKLLDLRSFADSYATYDIIASRWRGWGYVYAFTELALGIAYLVPSNPLMVNTITFVIMSVSIIGVLKSVLQKKKIRCACLGAFFNLPMSTVTILEDALMILMSSIMIIKLV